MIHTLKRDLQNSSPFWPTGNPGAVPQPSASASLACVSLCTALEGPASAFLDLRCPCTTLDGHASASRSLRCPCATLVGPVSPLKGCCCLCAAFCMALAKLCISSWPLCCLVHYLSAVVVFLASDQIIPCQSLPLAALQTRFEILSKPCPRIST